MTTIDIANTTHTVLHPTATAAIKAARGYQKDIQGFIAEAYEKGYGGTVIASWQREIENWEKAILQYLSSGGKKVWNGVVVDEPRPGESCRNCIQYRLCASTGEAYENEGKVCNGFIRNFLQLL